MCQRIRTDYVARKGWKTGRTFQKQPDEPSTLFKEQNVFVQPKVHIVHVSSITVMQNKIQSHPKLMPMVEQEGNMIEIMLMMV